MARLVVKSSFVSPAEPGGAAHLVNYVTYIATREGVELNREGPAPDPFQEISTRTDSPPTEKQERLIRQLLKDFPDCKDSLEYEDYLAQPSMASASEFIGRCMEDNFFAINSREGYIQYLATRPGAQRDGTHGLWGATDEPLDLDAVGYEVAHHGGNVWTHIISLRREDAVKTGMENAESWRELVRSQAGTIAHAMGVPLTDLRWYAAFHNESHHPHIHMVAYSVGTEPYLGKKGLQEIKSGLANEIFREELLETYQAQTQHRDDLTSQWRKMLAAGDGLTHAETQLVELAQYLSHHKGKAIYGYLPKQQRELVNRIVDELGRHPRIQALYEDWYTQRDKITGIYKGKPEERLPLSKNKTFNALKNAVITTAAEMVAGAVMPGNSIGSDAPAAAADDASWILPEPPDPPEPLPVTPEEWLERYPYPGQRNVPDGAVWPEPPEAPDIPEPLTTPEEWLERYPYPGQRNVPDGTVLPEVPADFEEQASALSEDPGRPSDSDTPVPVEEKENGWWTSAYKNARLLLYGSPEQDPDPEAAFTAMRAEAAAGNPLAHHDLGRMLLQGIGTEADPEAAAVQFQKALAGFKQEANGERPAYWQYRVGKMYAMGYGTEQDFTQAAGWYKKSVDLGNPFAAYALAGQYYRGQGVELDFEAAFRFYMIAATDENSPSPYAKWELAKMCEHGIGTTADPEAAATWYAGAYEGFKALERRLLDDRLVYRLGYMEYNGIGTEQDIPAAVKHFERAAKLKNPSAAYMLAKILAKGELTEKDTPRAAELLEGLKEDDFYAPLAAYHLGRLYLEEPELLDIEKGIANLEFAVQQKNPSAAYMLAKILAKGELTEKDTPRAASMLEGLKEDDFYAPLAAYRLGRLYLEEPELLDIEKGIANLEFAVEHKNPSAAYMLAKILAKGELTEKDTPRAASMLEGLKEDDFYAPLAAYRLGRLYLEEPELLDIEKGIANLEFAVQQKNPSAAYMLAKILAKGELTEKDTPRAAELLEDLKEDDFYAPLAAYHLGRLYLEEPELQDIGKGIANLEFAVEQKNPSAAYMLAKILAKGELTEKDTPRAAELLEGLKEDEFYAPLAAYHLGRLQTSDPAVWDMAKGIENLKLSSDQGNHFATYTLGRIYFFGQGEYHDRELGLKYLRSAADQGNEYAAQTLEQIRTQDIRQQASAALGLLRLFERSLAPKHHRQQKPVSDLRQRRKELEKKQAQGMKIG